VSEFIVEVNESGFEADVVLRSYQLPVVADFWAPWCGPCRVLGPLLERLAVEAGGSFLLAKVNIDNSPNLAVRFGVQGIPAVIAFHGGEISSRFTGSQPEAVVRKFLDTIAPREEDRKLHEARGWLTAHQWQEAERVFRELYSQDQERSEAAMGLVRSLLMQGEYPEADQILQEFPAGKEWQDAQRLAVLTGYVLSAAQYEDLEVGEEVLTVRYAQAARLISRGNYAAAMDGLLDILRENTTYRNGEPRKILLALFSLLGEEDPLTQQYREELASVLF